jgi:hypothetical protein
LQRREQPPRILRRTQQVSSLYQTCQFVSRYKSYSLLALPADDHYFMVVGHSIENGSQPLAQVGVRGFSHQWHLKSYCTELLYVANPDDEDSGAPPLLYNPLVSETSSVRLDRVLAQLRLYEHPLLNFSARAKGEGVEVLIKFKDETVPVHTYYFDLHPRDLDDSQFEWSFQRQLFDALHDYFVEMFIRTPQDRADRREKGL